MTNTNPVVGWTSAYFSNYSTAQFTQERRRALVDRIRKRNYNFNYFDHQNLNYCTPFYADGVICVLTKDQWNSVMDEVYYEIPRGARLMPEDVIERASINDVLYEKEKWEPKEGENNE